MGGPSTRAASSRIGDALTDGLSGILAEAYVIIRMYTYARFASCSLCRPGLYSRVEGPLQRVFTAIDERFDTMLTRIEVGRATLFAAWSHCMHNSWPGLYACLYRTLRGSLSGKRTATAH